MLLTAVLACVSGFTVATAADYSAATGNELVAAWNEAAASDEASVITITAPADGGPLTLTDEQKAQLNAITGTGNITVSMTDASGALSNFNYAVVNDQVQFSDITLQDDNDIVISRASDTTVINGKDIVITGSEAPKTVGAEINSENGLVSIGDKVTAIGDITVRTEPVVETVTNPTPAPTDQAYTRTTVFRLSNPNEIGVLLGDNVTTTGDIRTVGKVYGAADDMVILNGDINSGAAIGATIEESVDATGTPTSAYIRMNADDIIPGGVELGQTVAEDVTIRVGGGDVILGDNSVLTTSDVIAEGIDIREGVIPRAANGGWDFQHEEMQSVGYIEGNIVLGDKVTITEDSELWADDDIVIGDNALIEANDVQTGVLTAGGNIVIGENAQIIDNTSGLGVINLSEGSTLILESGAVLANNTSNGFDATIVAEQGSQINIYTDADDTTIIDGIVTNAANNGATPVTVTKMGDGVLSYGANANEDNFGGNYVQRGGDLVIGRPSADEPGVFEPAVMGTEDATYDIQAGTVSLTEGSTMRGESANFGDGTGLFLADGAALDFATPATLAPNAQVGILVTDEDGAPVSTGLLPKGTESISVTLNDTDISANLLNTPFVTTTITDTTGGLTEITQQMHGIDAPMSNYAGNVSGVAAALEATRLTVAPDSAAADFYDDLISVGTTAEAARIIQGISGEHVANFTWAATSTLNSFTDLGRIQSAASMLRNTPETVVVTDAKGSPISRTTYATGNGNIWVGGFGVWDDQKARKGVSGYQYDAGGYALGVDYKCASGSLIGFAFGQSFGSFTDNSGFGADYDVDSYMGMIYGRLQPDQNSRFALDYFAAYGRSEFDGHNSLLGSIVNGNADTDTFSGAIYATWTQPFAYGKVLITPYTGLEFSTSQLKGFTESGPDGRHFGDARAQNWTIPVGLTFARAFTTGDGTLITPALSVAVTHDVSRINPAVTVNGPLGAWNARGVNVGRTALRINAGVDVIFSSRWGMRVNYQMESRNKLTSHGISGAISYTF